MSITSWKKEFYPIPADGSKGGITAIKHSLRKWEGALPENLKKHDLIDVPIDYDDSTCSLCARYYDNTYDDTSTEFHCCQKCPIYKANDSVTCGDAYRRDYSGSATLHNPTPTIDLLKKTLKFYQDKRKKPVAKKEKSK